MTFVAVVPVSLFAQNLSHEREQHVSEAAELELVVANGGGGGAAATTAIVFVQRGRRMTGLALYRSAQERSERNVHVSDAVIHVADGALGLVKLEVRDVGAKHEEEADDGAADGVRLGVERDAALGRSLDVRAERQSPPPH